MSPYHRLALAAVFAVAFAARLAMALVVAPFQAPDEAAHLRYVEFLGRTGRLPVQPPTPTPHYWEQFYQPPLAYAALAALEKPLAAAGFSEHDRLRALRVANALLGSSIAPMAYAAVARLVPPGDWRPLLAALVAALLPGFAANASVLNNDTLANSLAAALWLSLLSRGPAMRVAVTSGLVLGAACLAKLSVLALAPLLFVAPLCLDSRRPGDALRRGAVAGLVAAAFVLPWLVRNQLVYGSPLAIGVGSIPFASLAGILPDEMIAAAARPRPDRAFLQFWGHFGIYNNLHWRVLPYTLVPLASLGLAGWVCRPHMPEGRFARAAAAALVALALAAAGLTAFSLRYHAAWQGRYLYTAAVPVAMLLAGGWHRIVPARLRSAFALFLVASLLALDALVALRLHAFFSATPAARWPFEAEL
jgi:hypothetical protein